ncbi:MAG: aminotransferase class III [Flavobacteriaceae bacterium]|nr:aminotransferase class III [Flavobacteriaceae bacterium]
MEKLLIEEFGINPIEIIKINGYDNLNYLIKTNSKNYILKTYEDLTLINLIQSETKALLFLNDNLYPKPIPFLNGENVRIIQINGTSKIYRLLSYLKGKFLGEINQTKEIIASFGKSLAKLNKRLLDWNDIHIKSRQLEWDMQHYVISKNYLNEISSTKVRKIIHYFMNQYEENVVPFFLDLRKSTIHNDANNWNILFTGNDVSGVIDFGDISYSHLINELAISISYTCFNKENPLEWAIAFLESYNHIFPLEKKEIEVLYYSIAMRLCISISNSNHYQKLNPDNKYISISQKPAIELLWKWIEINPVEAENKFKEAVGMKVEKIKSLKEMVKGRKTFVGSNLTLSYDKPIFMKKAAFQYMYDSFGKTYLDAYNNIPHVGHSHPLVIEASLKQSSVLNTNTRYLYESLEEYSEKLTSLFPKKLCKVFFVNSGSEASDLAIRMARYHSKNEAVVVIENGYHGHTQTGINISDYKFNSKKGTGQKDYILKLKIPDTFKGRYKVDDEDPGLKYAKDAIKQLNNYKGSVAAFISEPILSCAGQVPLANNYLKNLYPKIKEKGGVCISDEVQTGFGRLGKNFWGYESQEIVPDIIVLGKPMGNGHPIGAVITTSEIAKSFSKGVEFFSSFGGNPVSCKIGLSVLNVIKMENLQKNSEEVGKYYMSLLLDLKENYSFISDVRGSGLFLGIEFSNPDNLDPDSYKAQLLKNELKNNGILVGTDGPYNNIIKSKPPLCFSKDNAKEVVEKMDLILKKIN